MNNYNLICGLINYWPFDGNAKDVVGDADMFNGTYATFAQDRRGTNNSAVDLSFGYYSVPPGVYFKGDFTVSFWIFIKSVSMQQRVIEFGNGFKDNSVVVWLFRETTQVSFYVCQNKICGSRLDSLVNLTMLAWHHVAVTLRGNYASIFVNASFSGSKASNLTEVVNRNMNYLGRSSAYINGTDKDSNCKFDDLKIFDLALNDAQVVDDFNLRLSPIEL